MARDSKFLRRAPQQIWCQKNATFSSCPFWYISTQSLTAQEEDEKQGVDEQDIFYCMVLFLAAITRFLFSSVLGADDAPFGAVMGTSRYDE